jgi:hypothetical protein
MALSGITFNRNSSGLGRPLAGVDHISGQVFYIDDADLPSGFATNDRIKKIFSLAEAEELGITDTHIGEVKAVGTVEITNVGSNGNTIEITIDEPTSTVTLGTYTKVAGDTTVTNVADAIVLIINAGTLTHGYSASNTAGVISITSREGLGIFLNSGTPISTTIVGTIAATIAQFGASSLTDGVASPIDPIHYHISEYFREQPLGVLYVGLFDIPGAYTFSEVGTLIDFAEGEVKQGGVYVQSDTLDAAMVTALDAVLMTKESEDKPASFVLTADFNGTALSALPTLASNSDYRVSVDIAQDAGGKGLELYYANGKTIGTMGAMLGVISFAAVNECIGDVGQFNMSNGTELEIIGFGNGVLYKNQAKSLLTTLNSYKYNFLRKRAVAGSYYENSNTAIANTSDFAFIENVRTVDKAIRLIKQNCETKINSSLTLNANGTLFEDTIADLLRLANIGLDDMLRNGEISAYSTDMPSDQNVLTTSTVEVNVIIVPTGVARQIEFNVGLATSI